MKCVLRVLFFAFFAFACYSDCRAGDYEFRTERLVDFCLTQVPQENCVYANLERQMLVVHKVLGNGVVCIINAGLGRRPVFVVTSRQYVDGDFLACGAYLYRGRTTKFSDVNGSEKTVREFVELTGEESRHYVDLIKTEIEKKREVRQVIRDQERKAVEEDEIRRKAERQEVLKKYFEERVDAGRLALSNIVVVAQSVKKFVKSAKANGPIWQAALQAERDGNWMPVLCLCPADGWIGKTSYEAFPEIEELNKCIELFRKSEVEVVFTWGEKVPAFEVVDFDAELGSFEKRQVQPLLHKGRKVGCSITVRLDHKYFVCPVGGCDKIQKCYHNMLSETDVKIDETGLRGGECDDAYTAFSRDFFYKIRPKMISGDLFKQKKKQ